MSEKFNSLTEIEIDGAVFDEIDTNEESGTILRTLVDFKLFDGEGDFIDLNDLNKDGIIAHCAGIVVEPLPLEMRQNISKYASTISSTNIEYDESIFPRSSESMEIENNSSIPSGKVVSRFLDRENFKVGDSLDSYCNKTFKWYTSKVCEVDHAKKLIKVHFQGEQRTLL